MTRIPERIKYPKQRRNTSDKIISEAQLHMVFRVFKGAQRLKITSRQSRGLNVWFKPLVAAAFYAGLRRREITKLTWDKVNLERGYIRVTDTKSGQERTIPVRKTLRPYLLAWHRYSGFPTDGLVFTGLPTSRERLLSKAAKSTSLGRVNTS